MLKKGTKSQVICPKCNKGFMNERNLRYHINKKIPCDRILKCLKCMKIFRDKGRLNNHFRRKTSCEPILGNTQEPLTSEKTCHFCYREFKNKYTLNRHFRTCNIRNGNMPILFQKIKEDKKLIEELQKETKQMKNIITNITNQKNININIQNNSINNIIQINMGTFLEKSIQKNLINYGDNKQITLIQDILEEEAPKILKELLDKKIPIKEQVEKRIFRLIQKIHRNPQYPQLHNIFTEGAPKALESHTNPQKIDLYLWFENRWNLKDWEKIRIYLLQQILSEIGGIFRDKLKIKRNIMDLIKADPQRKRPKPLLTNEIFQTFEDARDPQDILFLKIALLLDKEGLLDIQEMNKILPLEKEKE